MKILRYLAYAAAAVALFAAGIAAEAHPTTSHFLFGGNASAANDLTVADRYVCHSQVDIGNLTVTDPSGDAVELGSGCTGHIASITVDEQHGDPIHVGAFAHDLTIDAVYLTCEAHDAGKHQDGIQVMGGTNIHFLGGSVACTSVNNSQAMVHEGAANQELPTNITFENITFDPQGAGAYGLSLGLCDDCHFINDTLLSHSHLPHDCYQGSGATNATWVDMTWPADGHTGTCTEVTSPPPTTSTDPGTTTTTPPPPDCSPDPNYTSCADEITALTAANTALQAKIDQATKDLAP